MKVRYSYLVYCNPQNPLVYAVYSNCKSAINYAYSLIEYREKRAKQKNHEFGYYHIENNSKIKDNEFDKREKTIFSACLRIKDNVKKEISEDGCLVKVVRYPIQIRY